ncbi:MAG: DUF4870 domain-containing protein [Leeuwenhoekiella sp.]
MILREDRSLLAITHLSQLVNLFTGIGGLIVPLIIWITQKEKVYGMDEHGKAIINFQISLLIYSLVCIPLLLLCGLGLVGLVIIGLATIIFPIINAIKVNNGETFHYPFSISIIK